MISFYKQNFLTLSFVSIFILSGCRVTLIPDYDATLSAQINQIAKQVDKLYLMMFETSNENNERAYKNFMQEYVAIEVELNDMLNKNKIRPLNENSIRICEITLQLWQKYKNEHKQDNTLSDGLIKLNRKTFNDLFYAMQVAETGKEIIKNPPQ